MSIQALNPQGEPQPDEAKSEAVVESPAVDWPALFNVPAFRKFCEATVKADEAERRAERED